MCMDSKTGPIVLILQVVQGLDGEILILRRMRLGGAGAGG